MPHDLLAYREWALLPAAMDAVLHNLSASPSGQTPPAFPHADLPGAGGGEAHPAGDYSLRDGIAVIEIAGVISRQGGGFGNWRWEGQNRIAAAVAQAVENPAVRALLLSIDSPGGVAAGTQELAHLISGGAAQKPIYAYADGLCASAAYWLAAACGKIYAPPTATIGSIGVVSVHCDWSGNNEKYGLRYTYLTGGQWKAVGNPDTPLSEKDRAYLEEKINSLHTIFKYDVAIKMPVDAAQPETWGDGQTFLAAEAMALGLITGIVANRGELIEHIKKEISMTKEELAGQHPELLAQIQAEARSEALAGAEQQASQH